MFVYRLRFFGFTARVPAPNRRLILVRNRVSQALSPAWSAWNKPLWAARREC